MNVREGQAIHQRRRRRDLHAIRPPERHRSCFSCGHAEFALVHRTMVPSTEQHEIVEAGWAAIGPMFDVMGVAAA